MERARSGVRVTAASAAARALGLRLATHNVSGLGSASKVHRLVVAWRQMGLHIVCIQETWLGRGAAGATQADAELWLRQAQVPGAPAYTAWWADNTLADGHKAGVGILVSEDLLRQGLLSVGHVATTPDGRVLCMSVRWAGHSFTLANSYWPANGAPAQLAFLQGVLAPAVAHVAPGALWLVGDFNHVPSPDLDRSSLGEGGRTNASRVAEVRVAAAVHDAIGARHELTDVYRARHPTTTGWTLLRQCSGSRLDRVYVPRDRKSVV